MLIAIVVYNKSINDLSVFKSNLLHCNDKLDLFIYDNSKCSQDIPHYENVNIYYEHDISNSGVSRAYNQAYKKAKDLNKKLLLVLDQDSEFEISYINKYMAAYELHENNYLYAPVVTSTDGSKVYSPASINNFVGKAQDYNSFSYKEIYSLCGKSVINSGLMIPVDLFEKIGGYNESLKLDFSDIYFIEKYKKLNENIILVDLYLKHSISGDEGKDFNREYNRFKYYCSSAKEIGRALDTVVFWSPFRRLLRLIIKYKKIEFIKVFYEFYLKGNKI